MNPTHSIIDLLEKNAAEYTLLEHEPVFTSKEAAEKRGTLLKEGAKALIWKSGEEFLMTVASAERRIDMEKLKTHSGFSDIMLARPKEVRSITECNIGSVPPFGNIFGLKVMADNSLFENEYIAFNAGSHTKSIRMRSEDYKRIVEPAVHELTEN